MSSFFAKMAVGLLIWEIVSLLSSLYVFNLVRNKIVIFGGGADFIDILRFVNPDPNPY